MRQNLTAVLPSNGSACVPVPGKPSVRQGRSRPRVFGQAEQLGCLGKGTGGEGVRSGFGSGRRDWRCRWVGVLELVSDRQWSGRLSGVGSFRFRMVSALAWGSRRLPEGPCDCICHRACCICVPGRLQRHVNRAAAISWDVVDRFRATGRRFRNRKYYYCAGEVPRWGANGSFRSPRSS